jgi:hypothetical protein
MKTIKVQYAKRYYKAVTKDVEVPEDVEDVESWIHENSLELFEDDIASKSLDFEDDEVHILEGDVEHVSIKDSTDEAAEEKMIERINEIIEEYGDFTVADVEADHSPALDGVGKLSHLMEDFTLDGGTVYVYDPQDRSSDSLDKYDGAYEDLNETELKYVLQLAEKWVEYNQ